MTDIEIIQGFKVWIVERAGAFSGYDVSSLVSDIEITSSLAGFSGKLTLMIAPNPQEAIKITLGQKIYVWKDEKPLFYGYIFNLGSDKSRVVKVTAFDNLYYFKNPDYRAFSEGEKTLKDVFVEICVACKLPYKITGFVLNDETRLHRHNFNDVSYFEMLSECMQERNNAILQESELLPRYYFIRCIAGVIELTDIYTASKEISNIKDSINPYCLDITEYNFNTEIENTFNEVLLLESADSEKAKGKQEKADTDFSENWRALILQAKATDKELIHSYYEYTAKRYKAGKKTLQEYERLKKEGKI